MSVTLTSSGFTLNDGTSITTLGSGSKSGNGYVKLPDGVIIQWGSKLTGGGNPDAITFPLTYPTACRSVIGILGTAQSVHGPCLTTPSTTGFSWYRYTGTTGYTLWWIAVGY